MNFSPDFIIATTVKRYLEPPSDKSFWKQYLQLKEKSPHNLLQLISPYITINEMEKKMLQKGDSILFEYILSLNGSTTFPKNNSVLIYEKEHFTPDDNDFYNRVIYESEISKLKEEVELLKIKAKEAIEAKKSFIQRDYQFIRQIGSGGFGTVSLVKHTVSNQLFAIKRLTVIDKDKQDLIKKEIETLASLGHHNIIGFRTAFNVEETLYLVMEYCPLGTLQQKLNTKGKLHEDEIISLFLQLTKTFEFLHQKGIIHHDIKPSNILFADDGLVKVSDFGCVNSEIGTRIYLPPEAHGVSPYSANRKSDIFALGVTLMECALGYHPFENKPVHQKIEMLKTSDLPVSQLPLWLQEIILKAVQYDPELRFSSMLEFHDALVKRNIPSYLTTKLIRLEKDAEYLSYLVRNKKWYKAKIFTTNHSEISENLNLTIAAGNFYLKTHDIVRAKECFETALRINPQANIEKQVAEVYLQTGEPTKAASILTSYINRNFNDVEAHNQLLYAYFLSNKWEIGKQQAELLKEVFPKETVFYCNHILFSCLSNKRWPYNSINDNDPVFENYNYSVFHDNDPEVWNYKSKPTLVSKLLFHEYKFRDIDKENQIVLTIDGVVFRMKKAIISFGRKGYDCNTFSEFGGNNVSRRHFVIINMKDNVWLYDLESTGVYVDGKRVSNKCFLLGLHKIRFGNYEIEINTDSSKLL